MTSDVAQMREATHSSESARLPSGDVLADAVQVALPPVAVSGGMVLAFNFLRGLVGDSTALRIARFVNLLLASILVGNGLGATFAIHPALRSLPDRDFFEAERAITPRYGSIMRVLMPAAVVSCVNVLRLMRGRNSPAFGLTVAGAANLVGVVVVTGIELPLNVRTMRTSPNEVSDWVASRERWNRFNGIRTALTLQGWALLCLAALTRNRD